MWLFDKEIYFYMAANSQETPAINRGMALHKIIRMISFVQEEKDIYVLWETNSDIRNGQTSQDLEMDFHMHIAAEEGIFVIMDF